MEIASGLFEEDENRAHQLKAGFPVTSLYLPAHYNEPIVLTERHALSSLINIRYKRLFPIKRTEGSNLRETKEKYRYKFLPKLQLAEYELIPFCYS